MQRLYAEAAAMLNAEDAARAAEQQASAAAFVEEFRAQWRADAPSTRSPSNPAQAWPGRWPRAGAGGATAAYRAGAPVSIIAAHGRWAPGSPVVLSYIRAVDRWKDNALAGIGL